MYFPQHKFLPTKVCQVVYQNGARKRSDVLLNSEGLANQGLHDDLRGKTRMPRLSFQSQRFFRWLIHFCSFLLLASPILE